MPPAPSGRRAARHATRSVAVVSAAFVAYAAAFIWRSSFVVAGHRTFCLFDDAMISMRYARNLAAGLGLVWNPGGPRVEGITNPLWTGGMALVHLLPLRPALTSLPVQALGAALLLATLPVVARMAARVAPGRAAVVAAASALTAFYYPLDFWSLMGMEVSLLALLVALAAWWAGEDAAAGRWSPRAPLILAAATLVRPDMIVPLAMVTAYLAVRAPRDRGRALVVGAVAALAVTAALTGLRLWYYGQALPNTYALKLTGVPLLFRLTRGVWVTALFALGAGSVGLLTALFRPRRQARRCGAWLAIFAGQLAYSIWVGGDAWEEFIACNRYVVVAMPAMLVLVAAGLWRCSVWLSRAWSARHGDGVPRSRVTHVAYAALVLAGWASLVSWRQSSSLAQALLLERPSHVEGNARRVETALRLRELTSPQASIAVAWAGIVPYFADRPGVDLLGKNDPVVARAPVRLPSGWRRLVAFLPGHGKVDYRHSLGELRPDVIAELAGDPGEAAPWLRAYRAVWLAPDERVWLRRDSPAIRWTNVPRHLLRGRDGSVRHEAPLLP